MLAYAPASTMHTIGEPEFLKNRVVSDEDYDTQEKCNTHKLLLFIETTYFRNACAGENAKSRVICNRRVSLKVACGATHHPNACYVSSSIKE